jgi:hypothetical protein
MAARERTDVELSGELEEIATSAAERLRALTGGDVEREADLGRRVGEAASRAIAAGLLLSSIAEVEQIGQRRAREVLGPDLLRRVERAGRRKREAEHEYEQAVVCAVRLGLAHRDVAAAAQVARTAPCARSSRVHRQSACSPPCQPRQRSGLSPGSHRQRRQSWSMSRHSPPDLSRAGSG